MPPLNALYGYGYVPDLGTDSDYTPTTGDVLAKLNALYSGPGGMLRSVADMIPASGRSLEPRGPDESLPSYWGRAINALSIHDMAKGGLGTAANWLQGTPEIGPDTLAPLGLAPMGGLVGKGAIARDITFGDHARSRWHGAVDKLRDGPEAVTGGSPGYSHPPDQYSPYGIPAHKDSSTGLSYYRWQGMRDAGTGETLPNPWPNYTGKSPEQRMIDDIVSRIERGDIGPPEKLTPYDQAVAHQQTRQGFDVVSGGRRDTKELQPGNDNSTLLSDQSRASVPGTVVNALAESQKPQGIRAYHGSPHDFDKFDVSKIGTGEGNQAFGHGLYFAEEPLVAQNYKRPDGSIRVGGERLPMPSDPAGRRAYRTLQSSKDAEEAIKAIESSDFIDPSEAKAAIEILRDWKQKGIAGRMYEVRINADPESFLDWDKPLSGQSEAVRGAFSKVAPEFLDEAHPYQIRDALEKMGSRRLKEGQPSREMMSEASSVLRDAGIPGIKYLDQGSRGAGEGSRNYVVFNDQIVDILKKYGLAGAIGAGAMASGGDAQASVTPPEFARNPRHQKTMPNFGTSEPDVTPSDREEFVRSLRRRLRDPNATDAENPAIDRQMQQDFRIMDQLQQLEREKRVWPGH